MRWYPLAPPPRAWILVLRIVTALPASAACRVRRTEQSGHGGTLNVLSTTLRRDPLLSICGGCGGWSGGSANHCPRSGRAGRANTTRSTTSWALVPIGATRNQPEAVGRFISHDGYTRGSSRNRTLSRPLFDLVTPSRHVVPNCAAIRSASAAEPWRSTTCHAVERMIASGRS